MNCTSLIRYALKLLVLLFIACTQSLTAKNKHKKSETKITNTIQYEEVQKPQPPEQLNIFKQSYPDLIFLSEYDYELNDWKIFVTKNSEEIGGTKTVEFYWSDGSLLPKEELANHEKYWPLIYEYPDELKDPDLMTNEEKSQLTAMSAPSSRRNGPGTPMFFFDMLYDAYSKRSLESHLVQTTFLGKKTSIHQRIVEPLKKVEQRILELAKTDEEVKTFVQKIKSADAYNWRLIDGTNRKSLHSYGIAVDILPVRITGEIFWSWARDKNPNGWMLTPLGRRWLPPMQVVKIFEEEGFIWGGKWLIWDNMHFEYHPELTWQLYH